jgi:hypothetical protein
MAEFNLRTVTDIQSRQDMEARFESHLEADLSATEKLVSYTMHIPTFEASDSMLARFSYAHRHSFGKTRGIG